MSYILGETREDIKLDNLEDNINIAIELAQQARYNIDIFTQDMDSEIYNHNEIETAIFKLAKRHPNTRIRILVQDSKRAAQNGHCLIRLAQSLTSSVFINNPSRAYSEEKSAFMIVDQIGLMHRTSALDKNYHTSINFMSPQRALELSDFFTEMWEHSTPDIQTRRIYV